MTDLPGLDEVDWASMGHAYGSAEDVPDMLRRLVSDDAGARRAAESDFYGAVHHQGDVYHSTAAAAPFLVHAVRDPGTPDRASILKLLASIGGIDPFDLMLPYDDVAYYEKVVEGTDPEDAPRGDADGVVGPADGRPGYAERLEAYAAKDDPRALAETAVAQGRPHYLGLLSDPDSEVREAACLAVLAGPPDAETAQALLDRLRDEPDTGIAELVATLLGIAAVRTGAEGSGPIREGLAAAATGHPSPAVRMRAFTELARRFPGPVPLDAGAVLRLAGEVREEDADISDWYDAEYYHKVLDELVGYALGDRVADRAALLERLLDRPGERGPRKVLAMAGDLVEGWRGDHGGLVAAALDALRSEDEKVTEEAARLLVTAGPLAAPVADEIEQVLEESSDGSVLEAATDLWANLGDPRAVPILEEMLEHPHWAAVAVAHAQNMGPAAADLAPALSGFLRGLQEQEQPDGRAATDAARALKAVGADAGEAVPALLALGADRTALDVLGFLGPDAAEAAPALAAWATGEDVPGWVPAVAARNHWRITGDAGAALPVLARALEEGGPVPADALEAAVLMGPEAAPLADLIRRYLDDPEYGAFRNVAAEALWRATGDAEAALPAFIAAWENQPEPETAHAFAEMGPAAAQAAPHLRRELARVRRIGLRRGVGIRVGDRTPDFGAVRSDEELRTACTKALAAVES
ncbi:hypothetical protein [Nocardiopsis potens]|uniref:hypothetical protein n=1 Tax=Nocardiopsis potens TaxID=1246458 RepID=UPI0003485704|nr:hypothetical protein [Nocardiopsis potens]